MIIILSHLVLVSKNTLIQSNNVKQRWTFLKTSGQLIGCVEFWGLQMKVIWGNFCNQFWANNTWSWLQGDRGNCLLNKHLGPQKKIYLYKEMLLYFFNNVMFIKCRTSAEWLLDSFFLFWGSFQDISLLTSHSALKLWQLITEVRPRWGLRNFHISMHHQLAS